MIRAVLGGSFDPVHNGHLAMADYVLERELADRIVVVPAWRSPHKTDQSASPTERLVMTRLAFADRARVDVDEREIDSGGVVFTVETLAQMQEDYPDDGLRLVVGADHLAAFATWCEPGRVFELAEMVVLARAGHALAAAPLLALGATADRVILCPDFHEPVASSEIRVMIAWGELPTEHLPPPVLRYIRQRNLYGA